MTPPRLFPLSRTLLRAATIVFALAASGVSRASDLVVVSAEAIPQYHPPKSATGKVVPQTYSFTEGKHFGANLEDKSDNDATFRSVIEALAPAMAKQAYVPPAKGTPADLLVVVHWGTTQVYTDPNRDLQVEQMNAALDEYRNGADAAGNNDPGRINQIAGDINSGASLQQSFMDRNAELLGFKRSLRKRVQRVLPSEEEITMRHETNEERYFIILMAYDYDLLRKQKKQHLLWTTHMSVRAAGTNFRIALPQLSIAASPFFGRDFDDPVHIQTNEKEGRVELGEPKVVPDAPH
jgi:hypothetical protein